MNAADIQQFVLRYLEATGCTIMEVSPAHVTVKLSPAADKDLTNRSYYWSFVDRTGAEPETMSFTFVFDAEQMEARAAAKRDKTAHANGAGTGSVGAGAVGAGTGSVGAGAVGAGSMDASSVGAVGAGGDSILGRYFGFIPTAAAAGSGRILNEPLTFGSRRLDQIFHSSKSKGRFLCLFEEPLRPPTPGMGSIGYSSWLGVNFKVEFKCDMKRDELHSLAMCLSTGEIVERFQERLTAKKLVPKLPPQTHLRETISLRRAAADLERYVEKKLHSCDHRWATEAQQRLSAELERIQSYYEELLRSADDDTKAAIQEQYDNRKLEIEWQYRPRVEVSVINGGLFHLSDVTIFGL